MSYSINNQPFGLPTRTLRDLSIGTVRDRAGWELRKALDAKDDAALAEWTRTYGESAMWELVKPRA